MTVLSHFRFATPIHIRYADIDVLGHVNNATYFTYFEMARIAYMRDVVGWTGYWKDLSIIIAHASCDYKLPLFYGDSVTCRMCVVRFGNKSFDYEYVLVRGEDEIAATGKTTQVTFDYEKQETIRVPDAFRARVVEFEPGLSD